MQRINLYQSQFHPLKIILSATDMLWGLTSLLIVILLISVLLNISSYTRAAEQADMDLQLKQKQQELAIAQVELKPKQEDSMLLQRRQFLQKDLANKQQLLNYLQAGQLEQGTSLYRYMSDFAMQKVDGIWLKKIILNNSEQRLELQGWAARSELVPKYIENMKDKQSLQGKHFNQIEINRDSRPVLSFTIASERQQKVTHAGH